MSVDQLIGRLRGQIAGTVRADDATCELYASDASLYRRRPRAVLRARAPQDLEAAIGVAAELGMPITAVHVSRPTLDDVFLAYTGSSIRDAEDDGAQLLGGQRVAQALTNGR